MEELGDYDPTLELSQFKMPDIDLLKDYGDSEIKIDNDELEANKERIVETLGNYSIGIASIKATIGPTITLYEIVPEAGIRISKIKNLEDANAEIDKRSNDLINGCKTLVEASI